MCNIIHTGVTGLKTKRFKLNFYKDSPFQQSHLLLMLPSLEPANALFTVNVSTLKVYQSKVRFTPGLRQVYGNSIGTYAVIENDGIVSIATDC